MLSSTCSAFERAGHERGSNVARSTNLFTRRELLHLSPILHRFTIVSKWILVSKNTNSEWSLSWGLGRIFLSLNQEFSFLWWFCSCFHLFFFPQRQVIFSLERKLLTKRQLCASLIEVHQNRNICPLQSSVIKSYRESIDKLCLHALKYQVNCCLSRIFSFCISVSVLLDID